MELTNRQWNRFYQELARQPDSTSLQIDNELYARWTIDHWEFYDSDPT